MDRNRESRRASVGGSNGFNRRSHKKSRVRGSPDEDGGLELQESVRLRERVKKDPNRDRERERERDRERERERERDLRERSSRSKRSRAERIANNRDDTCGDETSDESADDDDDDEYEENVTSGSGGVRMMSPAVGSVSNIHNHHVLVGNHQHHNHSSSPSQHQEHNRNSTSNIVSNSSLHIQHSKTFPPSSSAKVLRVPPVWKSGDEMISVSVPRKARSASTKRSHDWISSISNNNSTGGVSSGTDHSLAQPWSSPARLTPVSASAVPPETAPPSPSSSNASIRTKLKQSSNHAPAPKLKPPKISASSSNPSSSNAEDLEIEIAEVLYGLMTQSQGPSSSKKEESGENRLRMDSRSRNSSPISNLTPGPISTPLSVVVPKRKRPRQVPESSILGAKAKPAADQTLKHEILSPDVNKMSGSAIESASDAVMVNPPISQLQAAEPPVTRTQVSMKPDLELKPEAEEFRDVRDSAAKKDVSSSKGPESLAGIAQDSGNKDSVSIATVSPVDDAPINASVPGPDVGNEKEEKLEIDLMAPPRQVRSSLERDTKINSSAADVDLKPLTNLDTVMASRNLEDESESVRPSNLVAKEKKSDGESNKGRGIDLRLDLEKPECNIVSSTVDEELNKLQLQTHKQAQAQVPLKARPEKPGISASSQSQLLPMPMASWPGGLPPPTGYMAPLQGVVSLDGRTVAPAHIQPVYSQPRTRRCATHCHIAKNIHCLQQFMKMNPFCPVPAGPPAALFGSTPGNAHTTAPSPADPSNAPRGVSNSQDKGLVVKQKNSQAAANCSDSVQRKQQVLIQQPLPPPTNILGPTFIFPLNQPPQAAPPLPTPAKSSSTTPPPNTSATTAPSSAHPTAMNFNYPTNMPPNETAQYLAILQNNAYPFPLPTMGAPPNYRAAPAQAMPLLNGPFYSTQAHLFQHHLLQQQSRQQLPPSQPSQSALAHHNASTPNNSSSSARQLQQCPPQSPSFPNSSSSQTAHGGEDGPPPANDNRGSRACVNVYGQNFGMPVHPHNFTLMTHPSSNEKKSHQQLQQQQGLKSSGAEPLLPPHTIAMSFGPINGAPAGPGVDRASITQSSALFQNYPEATRQASVAAQKSLEGKTGNVKASYKEDMRKGYTFSRLTDMADGVGPHTPSSVQGHNTVIGGSVQCMNVATTHASRPVMTSVMVPNTHAQTQIHQQQMLQLIQQQQQQTGPTNAVNRVKVPVANGNLYSEHFPGPKFQNTIPPPFPQNLIQSNSPGSSPSQSPQWKNSARTPASQSQGPSSFGSSGVVSLHKNMSQAQHHSRAQQAIHTQISFGGNQKQSLSSQGQQAAPSNSNQIGSPTTSSISKGAMSGSPRTTSSASTKKTGHGSSVKQQPKSSPSGPSQKLPSILGNPHGAKNHVQVQQQAQPKTKQQAQAQAQAQLFFSSPYYQQSQPHHSMGSANSVAYMTQRRPDQHQRNLVGTPLTTSSGVLSLCTPISLCNTSTNDPATAIAAAACNAKGDGLQSQGVMIHGSPFSAQSSGMMLPAGFSYIHPVPAGIQVKPAEQKQPARNDNLHPWQQPEKK